MKRFLLSTLTLLLASGTYTAPVSGQDLPPEPQPELSPGSAPAPDPQASTPAEMPQPVTEHTVVEGPLKEQRQQLYNQLQTAKAGGIGIKNYMMAFNYVEGMAQRGESEEAIKKRMVPIITALASQLQRKEYLKTRPQTQNTAQGDNPLLAPGQNVPDNLRMFGGMGGSQTQDLIRKALENQGGGGLPNNLPAGIDPSMLKGIDPGMIKQKLKDPRVRELLKKYQGSH